MAHRPAPRARAEVHWRSYAAHARVLCRAAIVHLPTGDGEQAFALGSSERVPGTLVDVINEDKGVRLGQLSHVDEVLIRALGAMVAVRVEVPARTHRERTAQKGRKRGEGR